jgi:hypothetical protein
MRSAYKFVVGKPEGKNHSEDLDIDWRIIAEWISGEIGWDGVNCIHLPQDKNQ